MEESSCALCEKRAMMFCDSDQAKLCWDCDEKVHSANFLVAKHSRVLLCRLCHSATPWKASGKKLTPTVSFCQRCVEDRHARLHQLVNDDVEQQEHRDYANDDREDESNDDVFDDNDNDGDDSDDDGSEEEEEEEDEEGGEGENQVVPMSSGSATSSINNTNLTLKRFRNNSFSVDSSSHDETACSSSEILNTTLPSGDESTSMNVLKRHRY